MATLKPNLEISKLVMGSWFQIIGVIDEIVFQANPLAVEHPGVRPHGRGRGQGLGRGGLRSAGADPTLG